MVYKDTGGSVVLPVLSKAGLCNLIKHRIIVWIGNRSRTQRSIGMVASANVAGTIIGIVGSFVQAHFISPEVLGFIRKYSVVSGYAIFFSLGLFIILHREYAVLIGRGEKERANRTVAIVQSWCLLVSAVLCGSLLVVTVIKLLQRHWFESAAWFIQVVAVWSTLYVGFLDSTFRSGQEFERRAKGQFIGALTTAAIIPVFWLWSLPAFVLRSIIGPVVSGIYLHVVRPVKVVWCFPWREFLDLVKRGMRLFVSDYLRYNFWLTVEIWLMLYVAGNKGVGLYVFSTMITTMSLQVCTAINMVYIPQLAQGFGQTEKITTCLKLAVKPTLLNLGISIIIIFCFQILLPPLISYAFPKYVDAIPMMQILILRILLVSLTLPVFMLTILESYITQFVAVIVGLITFIGTVFALNSLGFSNIAVPWGTLVGQMVFTGICLSWLGVKTYSQKTILSIAEDKTEMPTI
jgi:O-antigen/teichoic acid export membrane protein